MTRAVLGIVLGAAGALPASGQVPPPPDTVSYPHPDGDRQLLFHRDSLVAVTEPSVSVQSVVDSLPAGVTVARTPGAGVFVLGVDPPALSRPLLFQIAAGVGALHSGMRFVGPMTPRVGTAQQVLSLSLDRAVVLFHSGTSEADMQASVANVSLTTTEISPNHRHLRLLDPATPSVDVYAAVASLAMDPDVKAVSLEIVQTSSLPPYNTLGAPASTDVPAQWHHALIRTSAGWSVAGEGEGDVTIAVIESNGFDTLNVDVKANLWLNPEDPTNNGVDDELNGLIDDTRGWSWTTTSTDFNSSLTSYHGTAVAGVAAGAGLANGGVPARNVIGVCPDCTLMLLDAGQTIWGRAQAFLYARDHGASVVNASWSATPAEWVLEVIIDVVGATGRGGRGLPIVFSAGNDDIDVCSGPDRGYPSLSQVIAVAASDSNDEGVPNKGRGNCIDLAAPGPEDPAVYLEYRGVTTADSEGAPGLNYDMMWAGCGLVFDEYGATYDDYTRCFPGTSPSAAEVSGAAALMIAAYPGITAPEIASILRSTAFKIPCLPGVSVSTCYPGGRSDIVGYGRLDVGAAVQAAEDLNPDPPCWCFTPIVVIVIIIVFVVFVVILIIIIIRCPPIRLPWPFGGRSH